MAYVACQMRIGADPTHQECVEEAGYFWFYIYECAQGDFAVRQMLTFEQMTGEKVP